MTWQVDFYEEEDGSAPVKELANAYSVEPFL
jgi:hypothetical protein